MKIKILHLYRNLMNLYGDYANTLALSRDLAAQGAQVGTVCAESLDGVALADFDFLYVGSGTEKNQKAALADILAHADEFKSFADSGKPALFTGNAFEMLGESIVSADLTYFPALGIGNFKTEEQDKKRISGDVIAACNFLDEPMIGYINKCGAIIGCDESINILEMGTGNDNASSAEGFRYKNIIGTHIIGPVLIKNPHFLRYISELVLKTKEPSFDYKAQDYPYELAAYEITLKKLREREKA